MRVVTPEQMKELERISNERSLSYLQLMKNAGTEIVKVVSALFSQFNSEDGIVILCGNGNNGGDGFVCAKQFLDMGIRTKVFLLKGYPKTDISKKMLEEIPQENITQYKSIDDIKDCINECGLIIDAVFGTGFKGDLSPEISECFSIVNKSKAIKVSVDIPSGSDALTGMIDENSIIADYTVTFGYKKVGMCISPCKEQCGNIIVADIGLVDFTNELSYKVSALEIDEIISLIPKRKSTSHKGNYGRLVNIAGSNNLRGAAALSTLSALRSGVGLCTLCSVESVVNSLSSTIYEAMYVSLSENEEGTISYKNKDIILKACENATAITLGCGLGTSDDIKSLIKFLIKEVNCPIILDADGINAIGSSIDILMNSRVKIIVTPHPAELARLLNITTSDVLNNYLNIARDLAINYNIIVVAKNSSTIIADNNGNCYINTTGNAGLSRGGSGDVLTGIIGSFVAQGLETIDAAKVGVFLHGLAADMVADKMSMQGMLPTDVIAELPLTFNQLLK